VKRIAICGLALDVCVRASALDAARVGFETHLVAAATRPVSALDGEAALRQMETAGIIVE
jgi:nicotinamidase/pyrazinamidase